MNSVSKETMLEASYITLNIITAEIHPTTPFRVESVKMEPSSETNVSATVCRRYEIISQEDVIRIDAASRRVLGEYGIKVSDPSALGILESYGCSVDRNTMMVRIPSEVIDRSLESAPSSFTVYGRGDDSGIPQGVGGRCAQCVFGCGLQVCEYVDGKFETRDSNESDLADMAVVADYLENIDIVSTAIQCKDLSGNAAEDVHQFFTVLRNTAKHVMHINPVAGSVGTYAEIMDAFYGGDEAKAESRPLMSMYLCASSPLEIGENNAGVIVEGARRGIPMVMSNMALAGASGPGHLAGSIVLTNCEVLGQVVLSQAVRPGTPVWYGTTTTIMDMMESVAPMGNPEIGMVSAACAQLASFYGLPSFGAGIWSDSKVPDGQASAEKTQSLVIESLAGCDAMYGAGSLELGSTFSAEQLVIDDRIIADSRIAAGGIRVDDETLSVEAIEEVGACNDYLAHPSTMDAMMSYSTAGVFDRSLLNGWRAAGSMDVVMRAHEKVLDIRQNHHPEPIAEDVLKVMEDIVARADEPYSG